MRKFIPSFIFTFALAVSFLAPVQNVSAAISNPSIKANISTVSAKQILVHNYGYDVCPGGKIASAKSSFFDRLLAFVGITRPLPAQKLAESSADCGVLDITSRVSESRWFCIPRIIFNATAKNSFSCSSDEYSKRSDKIIFSSKYIDRYGLISCTTNHIYANPLGTIATSCYGPKAPPSSTWKVTYPPSVDISGNGSYGGKLLVSAIIRDSFYLAESLQTMLTIFPETGANSGSTYRVPIGVTLTRAVFNGETKEFDYAPVPCTSITVAGKALDKNCQTTITMEIGSVNVTPTAPVPYYIYSVFVSGAITEK